MTRALRTHPSEGRELRPRARWRAALLGILLAVSVTATASGGDPYLEARNKSKIILVSASGLGAQS